MKTFSRLTVQQKLYIIPAFIIGIMFLVWGWFSATSQTAASEESFRGQLSLMAQTSAFMAHGSAEELAVEKGWVFHRVLVDAETDTTVNGRLEHEALAVLKKDAALKFFEERLATDSADMMAVFVPARISSACYSCHNEGGIDIFSDKQEGELVAVFGVSGSLQAVETQKSEVAVLTVLIMFLCIAVTVLSIRTTSRTVVIGPVQELVRQSEKVATGDLRSMDTPYLASKMESSDEIGTLARAYKSMLDSLRDLILRLKDSSMAVSSAASQISSTSEEIAAGTFRQTGNVNEVSSSITQISGAIHSNAGNANQAAETAASARTAALRGEELVRQTIEGMQRIAAATQQTAETVNKLERSSEHINEIIGVIDGIADQTNLLALNAAIEAARAGEQGRGFAVVAAEVQKLADRTTSATKEIGEMITRIQVDTRAAVHTMQDGAREVEGGIRLAEQAGTALSEIRAVSETMRGMVEQIAVSNREQSISADQITMNVTAITGMTEQTATGVQQISQSLEELNSMTIMLQGIVDRFALDPSGADGQSGARTVPARRTEDRSTEQEEYSSEVHTEA